MLFRVEDIKLVEHRYDVLPHKVKCMRFINERVNDDLHTAFGTLTDNTSYHFATNARWSLHDLIVYYLSLAGPAELHFITWSVKEYQAKLFTSMKERGLITAIHALLDYRNSVQNSEALYMLEKNSTSLGFQRTHAKVTVISNDKWSISIVGSLNLTENTKNDAGVITVSREMGEFWINYIKNSINETIGRK